MSEQQPQRMNHESLNDTSNPPPDSQSGVPSQELPKRSNAKNVMQNVTGRIVNAAGVEALEEFNLIELFSEVFKKHSADEVEEYFTVGTASTTPVIHDVETNWPKPWVFFRTFTSAIIVYFGFVQAWQEFQNLNLIPGLITVGSFAIPLATLIFFFEVNVRKNVSLYQVIRLVFLGGILSLVFSLFLFRISNSLALSWLGASVAGLAEEPGKLLALLMVVNITKYRYIHNGLLFGAAVGTGFAAFESAGYALVSGLSSADAMLRVIAIRGLLAPFSHIVWTGMSAAALWKVKGAQTFEFEMLQDSRFLRVFAIAVVLHMIWNSPIELPFYGKYLALGFIAWVIILGFLQDGLKQLRHEKAVEAQMSSQAIETSEPEQA